MSLKKPRDCICGYPKVVHSEIGHAKWCPVYQRVHKKWERINTQRWEEWLERCKDAHGRAEALGQEYIEPDYE